MKQVNAFLAVIVGFMFGAGVLLAQEQKVRQSQEQKAEHILLTPAEIKWVDGPPSLPVGARVAIIEGDLKKAEPIAFRLKLPANYKIMPHTHPGFEHVTVLSGTFYLGPGDTFDPAKAKELPVGSFAVFSPNHTMFGFTKEKTIIQVHAVGPWGINYVNPADDPRKKAQ